MPRGLELIEVEPDTPQGNFLRNLLETIISLSRERLGATLQASPERIVLEDLDYEGDAEEMPERWNVHFFSHECEENQYVCHSEVFDRESTSPDPFAEVSVLFSIIRLN